MTDGQIRLTIDDVPVSVEPGTSVFDAARIHGIAIPTLCHQQNEVPVGVCRVCVVDIGARVLAASCIRPAENGMVVRTNTEKVIGTRRTLVELLMADHPSPCARQLQSHDCELEVLAEQAGVSNPRYPRRVSPRGQDSSSLVIAVDHEACILCDRCIRGCDEIRHNDVLGRRGKGFNAGIAFDLNLPIGNSTCVSCGECMVSCPTGALTNKNVVKSVLPEGDPVTVDELLKVPYFEKVSGTFLDLNKHSVVKRHFKAGEIICHEGEYGRTAFYILSGTAEVFIASPMAHVKTKAARTGILKKISSLLNRGSEDLHHRSKTPLTIPNDGPVDLPFANPTAELVAGDLFGEMTCMNFYPRSATVRASTDCVMFEMLRNVLDIVQRNKTMRARLEERYRTRALDNHLRSVPIFSTLSQEFVDLLREKVQLVRYSKGDVIFRQEDIADSFYLVRIGFVKVIEEHPDGELVLAYTGKGGYFGEMGLLGEGRRTATVVALDHVEVVRIAKDEFGVMIAQFPEVARELEAVARQRAEQNSRHLSRVNSVPLDRFLAQGLMEANSLLLLDLERCTRCDNCVRACADSHDGVTRLIREGMRYDKYLVATSCRQCRDPLCMIGCPVGAVGRRNSLEVVIEDWCIGCGLCAKNCPYGNINMHSFTVTENNPAHGAPRAVVQQKATSCDLCTDLAEPSCVYACPHDAAHRVDPNKFFSFATDASGKRVAPRTNDAH